MTHCNMLQYSETQDPENDWDFATALGQFISILSYLYVIFIHVMEVRKFTSVYIYIYTYIYIYIHLYIYMYIW